LVIVGFAGVTEIETSVAAVTVSTAEPATDPDIALIVLVPVPTAVATPPAVIAAVPVVPDVQVTEEVRFCVLLSL